MAPSFRAGQWGMASATASRMQCSAWHLPAENLASGCHGLKRLTPTSSRRLRCPGGVGEGAAGNGRELCALARVNMSGAPGNRTGRPTMTFPVRWSSAHPLAAPGPRESLPGPAASIPGDPQVGSAFEAPGPPLGTFLVPSTGAVRHAVAATVPRHSRGGVFGSTRPAPDGRSPFRPAAAATRPLRRGCGLGARPDRP
jgi:hypothetical protein